ncbi:High mobility group [Dimargaris xerosporica]|nr:High mobility group [Dimargaris xerosporica]
MSKNPNYVFTRRTKRDMLLASCEEDRRGGRGKKRHLRIDKAPKHPMSAFLFYLADARPAVAQQYPGTSVGPISRIIAEKWKKLTVEERAPWQVKADADKARYARERKIFFSEAESNEPAATE